MLVISWNGSFSSQIEWSKGRPHYEVTNSVYNIKKYILKLNHYLKKSKSLFLLFHIGLTYVPNVCLYWMLFIAPKMTDPSMLSSEHPAWKFRKKSFIIPC